MTKTILLGVSVLWIAGCGAPESEGAGAAAAVGGAASEAAVGYAPVTQPLYVLSSGVWNRKSIRVCWKDGGYETEKGWVRNIVESTYERNFDIDFTYWGRCQDTANPDIRIAIRDVRPNVNGVGMHIRNNDPGMELNFIYKEWNSDCRSQKRACIESTALHEFGHALAFRHEQNRDDTPAPCDEKDTGERADMNLGPWDPDSIMNYCNDATTLSAGDKAGGAFLYGATWSRGGESLVSHQKFCFGGEVCRTGDINNDGRDDIIAFVRSDKTGAAEGDVWVAYSDGVGFEVDRSASRKAHDWFCLENEDCHVGDVNGDGAADLIAFTRRGPVWVALNDGRGNFGAASIWHDWFCVGNEVCRVGDADGDGRDDIFTFVRDNFGGAARGDVYHALSTGTAFRSSVKIHDWFCIGQEQCEVGDLDNDGRADLVTFIKGTSGTVYASYASHWRAAQPYGHTKRLTDGFCLAGEDCAVAHVSGSRGADLVAFSKAGAVWVAYHFSDFVGVPQQWHGLFCVGKEVCRLADVNGDGNADLLAFTRGREGWVWFSPSGL